MDNNEIISGSSKNDYAIHIENGNLWFEDQVYNTSVITIGRGFHGVDAYSAWGGVVSFGGAVGDRYGGIGLHQGIPAIAALNEDGEIEWHTIYWHKTDDNMHLYLDAREWNDIDPWRPIESSNEE